MLSFLFRGLTASQPSGAALFDAVTAEARRPFWYQEGGVPDSLDGRFAVLATIAALVLVRLEQEGASGNRISVALTERFVAVMECEHRELGIGDPALGKTVRKLVSMLAKRTDIWRSASDSKSDWTGPTRASLYKIDVPAEALQKSAEALRSLGERLSTIPVEQLDQGKFDE